MVDEVIVVDDCSFDRTFDLAKKAGAIVLRHSINRGQGAALETGNQYAFLNGAQIIAHFDADGQFSFEDLKRAIKEIKKEKWDVVLGSRFLGTENNMPFLKKQIIFPLARFVNRIFFNIKLSDPQSGFRVFKRDILKKIKIENDGAAHCSEILHKLNKNHFKIREIPITVRYDNFGQSFFSGKGRGMGGVRILKDLIFSRIIN